MTKTRDVIEINGRRYDSVTGHSLNGHAPALSPLKNIDNLHMPTASAPPKRTVRLKHSKTPANAASHHHPQKAKTLMRGGLKKPPGHTQAHRTAKHTRKVIGPDIIPASKHYREHREHSRTTKSPAISRFGDSAKSSFIKRVAVLPVVHPEQSQLVHHQPHKSHHPAAINRHGAPKKARLHHVVVRRIGKKHTTISAAATGLAVFLFVLFLAYQNIPNFQMRVAAQRAGFSAQLPGYRPPGYTLQNPIAYAPAKVSLSFYSKAERTAFKLTQSPTNWNSEAFFNHHIASSNRPYQIHNDTGKTIYFYEGANAVWLDKGVLYQLEGNARLTADQLIRIAKSV